MDIVKEVEQKAEAVVSEVKADIVKAVDAIEGKVEAAKKELSIETRLFVREAQLKIRELEDKAREVQTEISNTLNSIRQRVITEAKAIGVDIEKHTLNLETLVFDEVKAAEQTLTKKL